MSENLKANSQLEYGSARNSEPTPDVGIPSSLLPPSATPSTFDPSHSQIGPPNRLVGCYSAIDGLDIKKQRIVKRRNCSTSNTCTSKNNMINIMDQEDIHSLASVEEIVPRKVGNSGETSAEPKQHIKRSNNPPEDFICPLTREVMVDPMLSPTGLNFERSAILDWLYDKSEGSSSSSGSSRNRNRGRLVGSHGNTTSNCICPITGEALFPSMLVPNKGLKMKINRWRALQRSKNTRSSRRLAKVEQRWDRNVQKQDICDIQVMQCIFPSNPQHSTSHPTEPQTDNITTGMGEMAIQGTNPSRRDRIHLDRSNSVARLLLPPRAFEETLSSRNINQSSRNINRSSRSISRSSSSRSINHSPQSTANISLDSSLANFLLPPKVFEDDDDDCSTTSSISFSSSRNNNTKSSDTLKPINDSTHSLSSFIRSETAKSMFDSNHSLSSFFSYKSCSTFGDSSTVVSFTVPPKQKSEVAKCA